MELFSCGRGIGRPVGWTVWGRSVGCWCIGGGGLRCCVLSRFGFCFCLCGFGFDVSLLGGRGITRFLLLALVFGFLFW